MSEDQPGTSQNEEIPGIVERPSAIVSGAKEGMFEALANQAASAAPIVSIKDLPMNSLKEVATNGTGSRALDRFAMPLIQKMPGFKKMAEEAQEGWDSGLLHNRVFKWATYGKVAAEYTKKYFPGEDLGSLVSKAGELYKADTLATAGAAMLSPVNVGANIGRALTQKAWLDVADYAANRAAYHISKMAVPILEAAALGPVMGPSAPIATFAAESAGRNALELEGRWDLTPAKMQKVVVAKAVADGFMGYVATAIPGIAKNLGPFSEEVMRSAGKAGVPIMLAGVKAMLEESIVAGLPRMMIEGSANFMANQIVMMLVDQHYKIREYTIQQAITATVEAGLFGALVHATIAIPGGLLRKYNIRNGLLTFDELMKDKLVITGWINGFLDKAGVVMTPPHMANGILIQALTNIEYMLENKLFRDADLVYRTLAHFSTALKDQRGEIPVTSKSKLELNAEKQKSNLDKYLDKKGREILGKEKPSEEAKNLKIKMRAYEKGSRYGLKEGREEAKDALKELMYQNRWREAEGNTAREAVVKYLKDYAPKEVQPKFLVAIRDAKLDDLPKIYEKVDRAVEKFQSGQVIENIQKLGERIKDSNVIAAEHKQQVSDILGMFNASTPKEATLEKLKDIERWIKAEQAAKRDTIIPEFLLQAIQPLKRTNLRSLSLDELKNMYNDIRMVADEGRKVLADRHALDTAKQQSIIEDIERQTIRKVESKTTEKHTSVRREKKLYQPLLDDMKKNFQWDMLVNKSSRPMYHLLRYMCPEFPRIFKDLVDNDLSSFHERHNPFVEEKLKLLKDLGLDGKKFDEADEAVGVYAWLKQEGGREKLLLDYTEDALNTFEKQGLTPEEMKVYNFIRADAEAIHPEFASYLLHNNNIVLGYQENYLPFMSGDANRLDANALYERITDANTYSGIRKNVDVGHSKARTDKAGARGLKAGGISGYLRYREGVDFAIATGKTTRLLQEIASDKIPFSDGQTFGEKVGRDGQALIREWLDVAARKGGNTEHNQQLWKATNSLGNNLSVAYLTDLKEYAKHYLQVFLGAGEIGHFAFTGEWEVGTNPECRKVAYADPTVRKGMHGVDPNFDDIKDQGWGKWQRRGLAPITWVSMQARAGVWAGGVQKWFSQHLPGEKINWNELPTEAIRAGKEVVEFTQPGFEKTDSPLILSKGIGMFRSPGFSKLLFRFMTPAFYRYGQMARGWEMATGGEKGMKGIKNIVTGKGTDPVKAAMIAGSLITTAYGEALIVRGFKAIYAGLGAMLFGPSEDHPKEDPVWKETLKDFAKSYPVASLGINAYEYGSMPGAVTDAVKQLVDGLNNIGKAKKLEGKLKWSIITGEKFLTFKYGIPFGMSIARSIQHDWKLPKAVSDDVDKTMAKAEKAMDIDALLEKQIAGLGGK